jgi:hypothetical protein
MALSMVSARRPLSGGSIIATTLVAVGLAVSVGPVHGAGAWVKRLLPFGHAGETQIAAPPTARFLSDDGETFILDRSGARPLLKFDASPEVWALSSSRGPRGDIIYANDLGEPLLRATKLGGMTVFDPNRPEGSAVTLEGPCGPLRLSPVGPLKLFQRLNFESARASRAARHLIIFEAPDVDINSDGLTADAAGLAADAMVALSGRAGGGSVLARVNKAAFHPGRKAVLPHIDTVVFELGATPGAIVHKGVVVITITPAEGIAGRPSSERILQALAAR